MAPSVVSVLVVLGPKPIDLRRSALLAEQTGNKRLKQPNIDAAVHPGVPPSVEKAYVEGRNRRGRIIMCGVGHEHVKASCLEILGEEADVLARIGVGIANAEKAGLDAGVAQAVEATYHRIEASLAMEADPAAVVDGARSVKADSDGDPPTTEERCPHAVDKHRIAGNCEPRMKTAFRFEIAELPTERLKSLDPEEERLSTVE